MIAALQFVQLVVKTAQARRPGVDQHFEVAIEHSGIAMPAFRGFAQVQLVALAGHGLGHAGQVAGVGQPMMMVVVDLAKVLIGSHNWSEGSLSGERDYESSVLLVLPEQDMRFADYVLGRQTVSDMRSKELWEQEISRLRQVVLMKPSERATFLREQETPIPP